MKKLEKVQVWAGGDHVKMILAAHEPGVEPKLLELACLRGAKAVMPLITRSGRARELYRNVLGCRGKLGNLLWGWPLDIPDPACAALEIGRRYFTAEEQGTVAGP